MGDRWGAAFVRIGWQASFGLGGSFAPDWVAGITGIRTLSLPRARTVLSCAVGLPQSGRQYLRRHRWVRLVKRLYRPGRLRNEIRQPLRVLLRGVGP